MAIRWGASNLEKSSVLMQNNVLQNLSFREKLSSPKLTISPQEQIHIYHTLFDTIPDALFILHKSVIWDCNSSSEKVFGMPRLSLIGTSFIELFYQTGRTRESELMAHKMEQSLRGAPQTLECSFQQNRVFEILLKSFPASDKLLAVVHDITTAKNTHEALKTSEERFRDIVQHSIDGYYFISADGEMTHLNESGHEILTYSRDELNQKFFRRLNEPNNRCLRRLIKNAMSGKSVAWQEIRYMDRHNTPRWIAYSARPVCETKQFLGIEGFIKDITAQKNAESELIENEARYRALLQSIPFAVFGISLDYYFIKTNCHFEKQYGNLEGVKVSSLKPSHLSCLILDLCKRVKQQKATQEQNIKLEQQNIFRVIIAPIHRKKSAVIGFGGMLIDVTKNMQALDEQRAFAEKLIQTSEDEQRRISREIHDSLGQLLLALQLEITAAKSALPQNIQHAETLLTRSEELLSKLLREAGDLCHRLRPRLLDDFGLIEALNELVEPVKKLGINVVVTSPRYSSHQQTIETAVYRICQEALSNILKHANATNIEIILRDSIDSIFLSISDNGVGFELEEIHQKRRGFGLMNMKERVELLNGEFNLSNKIGTGTRIEITIPK